MGGQLTITFDQNRMDFLTVSTLLMETPWGKKRTHEINRKAFENSICAIALIDGRQVGFARASGDKATFARLADVIVWPDERGQGVGKALVEALLDHPELREVGIWTLTTDDAQGLYARYGFKPVSGEHNLRLDR